MNVFMPCATIEDSVRALDDKRLIKQILECKQIIDINIRVVGSNEKVCNTEFIGYERHPVVQHYREEPYGMDFLFIYGKACCDEFEYRFEHEHALWKYFDLFHSSFGYCRTKYMYAEGSKNSPDCIRETDNEKVFELFKQKLIKKWDNDKYPPRWTNREKPSWYKGERK